DDLFLALGVEKGAHGLARGLVGFGRLIGEVMQPAVHVGILLGIGFVEPLEHGLRLLRRGGVVEISERLAIDLKRQRRKILADAGDVIGAIGRMHVHPRALSQSTAAFISAPRMPSCAISSIVSPMKAWISSASASRSEIPRDIR